MRSVRTLTTATLVAATAFGGLSTASTAQAITKEDVALNGTFRATSIGDWAQRNDQYFGEPTVYQVWTISSTCDSTQECHGTVKSDQGWSAALYMNDGEMWKVRREVPNWERCEDGTAFPGQQTILFLPGERQRWIPTRVASPLRQGQDSRSKRCLRAKQLA